MEGLLVFGGVLVFTFSLDVVSWLLVQIFQLLVLSIFCRLFSLPLQTHPSPDTDSYGTLQ